MISIEEARRPASRRQLPRVSAPAPSVVCGGRHFCKVYPYHLPLPHTPFTTPTLPPPAPLPNPQQRCQVTSK